MPQSLLVAFIVFAVVMFFTLGPNNIMVLSSGLTYGFRRTLPHIAGVTFGVGFVVAAAGLGLGTIFIAYPVLQTVLKYAGAAYLIYLAAMIAMSGPPKAGEEGERGPMTFWGAAVFQWVNVKGWVMVMGTITAYPAIALSPQQSQSRPFCACCWACSPRPPGRCLVARSGQCSSSNQGCALSMC